MSRYRKRTLGYNIHQMYTEHFKARDVFSIDHYATPKLIFPSDNQSKLISFMTHIWSSRDKYYQLAQRYYNDSKLWWIIAQYNQAPTEQHLVEGQAIKIPFPLSAVYSYIGQE